MRSIQHIVLQYTDFDNNNKKIQNIIPKEENKYHIYKIETVKGYLFKNLFILCKIFYIFYLKMAF